MPLHGKHNLGRPGPHGHHPPVHGPGHHPDEHVDVEDGLYRQVLELKAMGASDDDLHDLIDGEPSVTSISRPGQQVSDPGRGNPGNPVDPMERARALFRHSRNTEEDWMTRLVDKSILVVAEFRPHILDRMLRAGIKVTQIHPPTPDGDVPPHFYHLCRHGFIGVLDFKALAEIAVDMLLFEGSRRSDSIYVSPLVPVTLRMFRGVEVAVLDADHRAPHMSTSIADKGFVRIPGFE